MKNKSTKYKTHKEDSEFVLDALVNYIAKYETIEKENLNPVFKHY